MADVELVITIDDKLYEIIKNPKELETMYHAGRLCEAVRNGTPLTPQVLADLFEDADEIIKALEQEPKKESEKCNYTIQNDLVVDGCRHKPVASTFSFFNECGDYKFCPYCGRKIEIEVEQ